MVSKRAVTFYLFIGTNETTIFITIKVFSYFYTLENNE